MPILEKAKKAVAAIQAKDVQECKSFPKPHDHVKMVLGAVCLLFGLPEDWASAKSLMGKMSFLEDLKNFDANLLNDKKIGKCKKEYINKPEFTEEVLQKISLAATALLTWAVATVNYYEVTKVVKPKQEKLKQAQYQLEDVEA